MKYDKNFEKVINYIFDSEKGFSNHKFDKGGRTNLGITQSTYNAWRSKKNLSPRDIKVITKEEAKQIYYEEFWKPSGAYKIQDLRESYLLFDMSVNSGPVTARRLYEKSNGNIYKYLNDRKIYYDNIIKKDPTQSAFREGWNNRLKDVERNMNELVNQGYYTPSYQNETTPYDKGFKNINLNSNFENFTNEELQNLRNKYLYLKYKNSIPTGFGADIELEQLGNMLGLKSFRIDIPNIFLSNEYSRIFTREDVRNMTKEEFAKDESAIMAQIKSMNGTMPTNNDMQQEILSGNNVVYVDSYFRADGTKVSGYYRRI